MGFTGAVSLRSGVFIRTVLLGTGITGALIGNVILAGATLDDGASNAVGAGFCGLVLGSV